MNKIKNNPDDIETKEVKAAITAVTVLEDRAQVMRELTLDLAPGLYRLRVADLSPVAVDRSLFVGDSSAFRINKLQVQRCWRIGNSERREDDQELSAEIKKLHRALRQLHAQNELESDALELLNRAAHLYMENINAQMPFAERFEEEWQQELRNLLHSGDGIFEKILELNVEDLALQKQLSQQEEFRQIQLGQSPSLSLQASIEVELEVLTAGPKILQFNYTVPCAMWRPMHRASLSGTRLNFLSEAALWQNSGEDWKDVQLSFSTARTTQNAEPAILHDDRLRVQRKTERRVQVEVREQEIASTGEGVEQNNLSALPGVDDGGETRLIDAIHKTSVRSNGRMHRVPLFEFGDDVELDRICYPELDPLVHLRSRQKNAANLPLLAGPVELLREHGYIGRSEIGFVAPNEGFVLGWGSDDALRVRRELEQNFERAKLTGKQTRTFDLQVYLSNLDDQPASFTLIEGLPISEIDKVQVKLDKKQTRPLVEQDDQGLLRWPIKLAAHGTDSLHLRYQIIADSSVDGI